MGECKLNSGFSIKCSAAAGVKSIYIGEFDKEQVFTADAVTDIITGFTPNAASGATAGVYDMGQDAEFAGYTSAGVPNSNGFISSYESTVNLKFDGLDNDLRALIMQLGRAPLYAIIESVNGEFFILGNDISGRCTVSNVGIGVAMGDSNGADVTITFKSKSPANLFDSSLLGGTLPLLG